MRRTLLTLGAASAAAGGAVLAARSAAARIQALPDPVSLERLRQEPKGDVRTVECPDGTALRIVVAGAGPTVVLAHGIGLSVLEWNLVWDILVERGYRVVAFDQRGHTRSTIGADGIGSRAMAGDYLTVLEAVDAHDAILVGHSMGGFLALAAVLEVPGVAERLDGLVLVGTFAGNLFGGTPRDRAKALLLRTGLPQWAVARSPTAATLLGATFFGEPSPAMVRAMLDTFLAQNVGPVRPILGLFATEDRYDRLAEIDLPTVVICGRKDRAAPPRHSQRLATGIPGARLVWVERKGHMLNWEAPEVIVDAVTSLVPAAVMPA
jgi:pimeloyl-ACP methyl ester carboxylesterase